MQKKKNMLGAPISLSQLLLGIPSCIAIIVTVSICSVIEKQSNPAIAQLLMKKSYSEWIKFLVSQSSYAAILTLAKREISSDWNRNLTCVLESTIAGFHYFVWWFSFLLVCCNMLVFDCLWTTRFFRCVSCISTRGSVRLSVHTYVH